MRILFDYKYNNYLGSLEFVLTSINNKPLFVCARANYGSGLRAVATCHANKAFRLNKYENSAKALKCSYH